MHFPSLPAPRAATVLAALLLFGAACASDRRGFAFLYGARILNQRAEIDASFRLAGGATPTRSYEADETLADALIGARYVLSISERWSGRMQADLSSGGTDLTWSAGPALSCALSETGGSTLTAGYRHMEIDFEDEGGIDAELTLSGFLLGLRLAF